VSNPYYFICYNEHVKKFISICFVFLFLFNFVFAENKEFSYHEPIKIEGIEGWYKVGERFLDIPKGIFSGAKTGLEIAVNSDKNPDPIFIRVGDFKDWEDMEERLRYNTFDRTLVNKINNYEKGKETKRTLAPKKVGQEIMYEYDRKLNPVEGTSWAYVDEHGIWDKNGDQAGWYVKYKSLRTGEYIWVKQLFSDIDKEFHAERDRINDLRRKTKDENEKDSLWALLEDNRKDYVEKDNKYDVKMLNDYDSKNIEIGQKVNYLGGEWTVVPKTDEIYDIKTLFTKRIVVEEPNEKIAPTSVPDKKPIKKDIEPKIILGGVQFFGYEFVPSKTIIKHQFQYPINGVEDWYYVADGKASYRIWVDLVYSDDYAVVERSDGSALKVFVTDVDRANPEQFDQRLADAIKKFEDSEREQRRQKAEQGKSLWDRLIGR